MEPDDSHVDFRYINNVSKNEKIRKIHNADTFTIFVPILISHFGLPLAVWGPSVTKYHDGLWNLCVWYFFLKIFERQF